MSEPLFRQEALDYWTRQRGPGPVLRLAAPWLRWLYWIVLALVVAGLALAFSARISQSASGPALVSTQQRTFAALLPAAASPELQPGRSLRIEVDELGQRTFSAVVLRAEPADDVKVRLADFGSFPQPAVLVTGMLAPDAPGLAELPSSSRLTGRAVVLLQSERLLTVLLDGLEGPEGGHG